MDKFPLHPENCPLIFETRFVVPSISKESAMKKAVLPTLLLLALLAAGACTRISEPTDRAEAEQNGPRRDEVPADTSRSRNGNLMGSGH
jgi:hypothetical protein